MSNDFCPIIKDDCIEHKCKFYIQIMGTDKNTGKEVNQFNCAIAFLPMLLIESASAGRSGAAATESFRNQMVKQNKQQLALSMEQLKLGLLTKGEDNGNVHTSS